MIRHIHKTFLDDSGQYAACEKYWERLIATLTTSLSQPNEWPRWIPRSYAGGEPFELDGNPIIDGRSQRLDRAFKIMQHPPTTENEIEIAAWLKSYESEYTDMPRDELVINLALSEETAQLVEDLLAKWMNPTTTPGDMNRFIRRKLNSEQAE
jgi:hypothetical protein